MAAVSGRRPIDWQYIGDAVGHGLDQSTSKCQQAPKHALVRRLQTAHRWRTFRFQGSTNNFDTL
jgi:hypothetical protein